MRVRELVRKRKALVAQTEWSHNDLPPRHAPVYTRTKPIRAGWQWRSARAIAGQVTFILLAECNIGRENYKAVLMIETEGGYSVVARFEDHGSHPGAHVHTHCERSGIQIEGEGFDNLVRIPSATARHRRVNA